MPRFFIDHKFMLVCALFLAFFIISPSWMFPLIAGNSYRGINVGDWGGWDDMSYIAKGREIFEGNSLGNVPLKIGKNASEPHQVYIEYLLLMPIKLFGLSSVAADNIVSLYAIYAFFGVFLLILSIYFFVLNLSGHKLLAAAAAIFAVGGYTLVLLYHKLPSPLDPELNIFSRPIEPVYGVLALFIYLNILIRALASSDRKYVFWSGLSFGALFYIYPYTWTFALALTGSLFLIHIFLRDWESAKKVLAITATGLALGAYMFIKALSFVTTETGRQILYFSTAVSRAPAPFSKLSFLVLVMSMIFMYKNRENKGGPLLLAIVLASWISLNQQVITGRDMQGMSHYFWYFTIPTSIVVGSYLLWSFVWSAERGRILLKKYGNVLLAVLIVIAFVNTARQQYAGTITVSGVKRYLQNYRPIIDVLQSDVKPGVILTSFPYYAMLFPVYTHDDLFWSVAGFDYNTPVERAKDALYVYMYLDKNSRNRFKEELRAIDAKSQATETDADYDKHYPNIYTSLAGYWSGFDYRKYVYGLATGDPVILKSRDETVELLFNEYKKVASPAGIIDILKKGEVNYIIWDKNKNPEWDLSPISGALKEVAVSNSIYLYKFGGN